MSTVKQLIAATLFLFVGRGVTGAYPSEALHLSDVMSRASESAASNDNAVEAARLELEMLEALGRTRVDFRPQLSILSFSNPLFLAASLGGSISVNRRTAPSPVALETARFALIEAEIVQAEARITSQIDAAGQFFGMAETQELAARACRSWNMRARDRDKVLSLVSANRITRLDVIRYEQDVNSLEGECVQAKDQLRAAATALARVANLHERPEDLRVSTSDLSDVSVGELPVSGELIGVAVESQSEFNRISQQIAELAKTKTNRRFHFDSFSTGYAFLKNAEQQYPDAGKQYLLGGNVGHIDGGFYFPLRNTGSEAATHSFLQARFDRLQQRFKDLKLTVQYKMEDSLERANVAADRLRIAKKKRDLANELRSLTAERGKAGLQPDSDELWAARDAERAETDIARLELEWKHAVFMNVALSHPESLTGVAIAGHGQAGAPLVEPSIAEASRIEIADSACAAPCGEQSVAIDTPPRPLQTVQADVPALDAAIIHEAFDIDVTVMIDEHGRVINVRPSSPPEYLTGVLSWCPQPSADHRVLCPGPASLSAEVLTQCVAAAGRWSFEPARSNGVNVGSKYLIEFHFDPASWVGAVLNRKSPISRGE